MATVRLIFALVLVASNVTFADDWAAPQPRIASSPDTLVLVRVVPNSTYSDAIFYRRNSATDSYHSYSEIQLPNRFAPVEFFVNDDGVLVTLDNWASIGYGSVISIFDPDGQIVVSYSLEDLYAAGAIDEFPRTVSSRYWRSDHTPRFTQDAFRIVDRFKNVLFFDLTDGSVASRGPRTDVLKKREP